MRDATKKSKQVQCTSCHKYKDKSEFPKLSRWNARFRFYCKYCLANNWVGGNTLFDSEWDGILRDQPGKDLNKSERNRLQAFIKNSSSYASGSVLTKQKVDFLVNNVRPRLVGSELINFDLAKQQYDKALRDLQAGIAPSCSICSSKMMRRTGRYGSFWGCTRYPYCKGTKNIR